MMLSIILVLLFVGVFASVMTQGLWSNTITLINVILAALIATNYFEPVAGYFDSSEPSLTYVWDFVTIWLLFGLAMVALRAATDYLSPVKVRFFVPVEKAGGIIMALWISWIVVCFTTATFHTAPLARNFLGGAFQKTPDAKMFFGLQPDRVWLGWMHRESQGTLSRFGGARPFDSKGDFIAQHANRRNAYEGVLSFTAGGDKKK
jgi:hypothetical protein